MYKRKLSLFLILVLVLSVLPYNIYAADLDTESKLIDEIKYDSDGYADLIIYLNKDLTERKEVSEPETQSKDIYIKKLKTDAHNKQRRIIELLEENINTEDVKSYESFFITNAIHVVAKKNILEKIMNFPEVSKIQINDIVETQNSEIIELSGDYKSGWNIEKMNLDKIKEDFNLDGEGIVIGFIDSGVDWTHPAIKDKWRGYDPETGEIDSEYSWLDLVGNSNTPTDDYSHGTAVVSIAVGGTEENDMIKGIAPKAKWIAARAFVDKNTTNVNIIKAAEWMLAPGGDPNKAPDIINNSWGGNASSNPWFEDILDAWKSVGIFPVFAAGNSIDSKAKPASIENPASLLNAFSVGAVNEDLKLTDFSKRGPSLFDETGKIIKPEVVAPGYNIRAAIKNGKYAKMYGTSIAAPHITGLAALMKQQNNNLKVNEIANIIIDSAQPLTDEEYTESPNMGYGYGMPDAYNAISRVKKVENLKRISGDNRFETAVELSKEYYKDGANAVYLTGGFAFTDALVMSTITNINDGPVLLSNKDSVDEITLNEIIRLSPEQIYIIGGENTISPKVEDLIESRTDIVPIRISGANRYETAISIVDKINEYKTINQIFLVNGYKEVDAISISGAAKKTETPVLLTTGEKLESKVKKALVDYGISKVILIGGENTLNKAIEDELAGMDIEYNRIGGKDRYHTSLLINENNYSSPNEIFIASGVNLVDALTSGSIAGKNEIPVILVEKNNLPDGVGDYIKEIGYNKLIILGGINSISKDLEFELIR